MFQPYIPKDGDEPAFQHHSVGDDMAQGAAMGAMATAFTLNAFFALCRVPLVLLILVLLGFTAKYYTLGKFTWEGAWKKLCLDYRRGVIFGE